MAVVYWIHKPDQDDFFSQGYIGYTSQTMNRRIHSHKCAAKKGVNRKLYTAMRKHGDSLVVEIVYEGSVEACLAMERFLRPAEDIGWNHGVGGAAPAIGTTHSAENRAKIAEGRRANPPTYTEESRRKISEAGKGRFYSAESRKKMSEKALARPKRLSWYSPGANRYVWAMADVAFGMYEKSLTQKQVSVALGLDYCKLIQMFKKFNSGWNPSEDPQWILFKDSNNNSETQINT